MRIIFLFSFKFMFIVFLIMYVFLLAENKKTYKIAYIGVDSPNSSYNLLNKWLLQKHLDKVNSINKKIKLELYDHSAEKKKIYAFNQYFKVDEKITTRNFYEELKDVRNVIMVIDNTWGAHLKDSKVPIKANNIPVISLNGDKAGNTFNSNVLFLGSDDYTPKSVLEFTKKILIDTKKNNNSVLFFTEPSYGLTEKFVDEANQVDINIDKINSCDLEPSQYKWDDRGRLIDGQNLVCIINGGNNIKVKDFVKNQLSLSKDKTSSPIFILNVHDKIGGALINAFNTLNKPKLEVVGGAYVVGSKNNYSENIFSLYLLTSPLDAVSYSMHQDIEQFLLESGIHLSEINNIQLLAERIDIASQIIDFAFNGRSKLDQFQISSELESPMQKKEAKNNSELPILTTDTNRIRKKYKAILLKIKEKKELVLDDNILVFGEDMVLRPNSTFEKQLKGGRSSYIYQINRENNRILNYIFGIKNLNITNISKKNKSFTADFFVWIKTADDLFDERGIKSNSVTLPNNKESDRSQGAFGSLSEYIHFNNLKHLEKVYLYDTISNNNNNNNNKNDCGIKCENEERSTRVNSYIFKVTAEFHTQFRYRAFPFDNQELLISMNITKPPNKARVSHDRSSIAKEKDRFINFENIFGWSPNGYYYTVDRIIVDHPVDEIGESESLNTMFQSITLRLPIKRLLLKPLILVITPILMIGLAAISVLYLKKLSFEGAGEVSVVILLALITYSLSIVDVVPAIETPTKAHLLFFVTFALVGLVFLYIVYRNSYLCHNTGGEEEEKESALKIAKLVSVMYFSAIVIILFYY